MKVFLKSLVLIAVMSFSNGIVKPGSDLTEKPPKLLTSDYIEVDHEWTLYIYVPAGKIVVLLSEEFGGEGAKRMKLRAREKYYDGLPFYRVAEGHVAQAGGFYSGRIPKYTADSVIVSYDRPWSDEFGFTPLGNSDGFAEEAGYINGFPVGRSISENRTWLAGCTGTMGVIGQEVTEFAIALQPNRFLDRNGPKIGRVIYGMEYVSTLPRTKPTEPELWPVIDSMRVAADLPPQDQVRLELWDTTSDSFLADLEDWRNPEGLIHKPDYVDLCRVRIWARPIEDGE